MYIGNSPANIGNYQVVDDISSTFNGVLTSFALTASSLAINPAKSGQLLVSINGVLQEPDDTGTEGFKVSGSNIVFSSAPATGSTFWAVFQGQNVDIGTPSDGVVGTAQMSSAELALTGGLSLGDNVKAKFGASDDLQIYHDYASNNSIINENGTGSLSLQGTNVIIKTSDGSATQAHFYAGDAVGLYYNNALKLATTSTGVDVTGSVTCDGFTSTGIDDNATSTAITIDSSAQVTFDSIGRFNNYINFGGLISTPAASASIYRPVDNTLAFGTASVERLRIDPNGKIFMNEGSPFSWTDGSHNVSAEIYGDSSDNLVFRNTSAKTERMRITSAGLLGVGTSDPKRSIHAKGNGTNNSGVLTEHYNGGRNYKNFYHTMTGESTLLYHHVKTSISPTASIMFRFDINGFNYGTQSPLEMIATGYAYSGTNLNATSNNTIAGTGACAVYLSSDNYICLRVYVGTSAYYAGFHVSGWFQNPTGYNHVLSTSSNTWTTSSSNQY